MKTTMYKRGKYHKQNPKEKKITFLSEISMVENLIHISEMKRHSISQVIRDAINEYASKLLAKQK